MRKRYRSVVLSVALVFAVAICLSLPAHAQASEDSPAQDIGNSSAQTQSDSAAASTPSITYSAHVQNIGWRDWVSDGATAGTTGQALRVEAFQIKVTDSPIAGGVRYNAHVQNSGWQGDTTDESTWASDGVVSGTTGEALRVEAFQIDLYGDMAESYDIYYRVHIQDYGWLGWAKNGEMAGSAGLSKRMEAVQVVLVAKGSDAPGDTSDAFISPVFEGLSHVQNVGWISKGAVLADATTTFGTTGRSLRMEALRLDVPDACPVSGGVVYNSHVQDIGWQGDIDDESTWASNGELSGTTGRSLRMEAVQIDLTGDMAATYDVYYRAHVSNFGWLAWAKNGEMAGTEGYAEQLEALQVVLVPKGDEAPSDSGTVAGRAFLNYSERAGYTQSADKTDQLVLVEATGTTATVSLHEKDASGNWSEVYSTSGFVGSNGVGEASESSRYTPEGSFDLPFAFGNASDPGAQVTWYDVTDDSVWVDDPSSPYYNTWQESRSLDGEVLSHIQDEYRYALVVGYNYPGYLGTMRDGCVPGAGSAFFLHCSTGAPTTGCVSVPESSMIYFIRNVTGDCRIVIGTRTSVYRY